MLVEYRVRRLFLFREGARLSSKMVVSLTQSGNGKGLPTKAIKAPLTDPVSHPRLLHWLLRNWLQNLSTGRTGFLFVIETIPVLLVGCRKIEMMKRAGSISGCEKN
ncbi:hypothetical protein OUZ56_008400 [Daphnia magna]|uniref:Uncharacterized protein n=1 Tax=Daphnia magna TaxID=35525 RepID=A0ABR0AD07_9CRUS|nr:hypothetical protein OUZ56_008400 [Daphnia magna]